MHEFRSAILLAILLAPATAQEDAKFTLNAVPLVTPECTLDAAGSLEVRGMDPGGNPVRLELRFADMELPAPRDHELRDGAALSASLDLPDRNPGPLVGKLAVTRFDWDRITLEVSGKLAEPETEVELTVNLQPTPPAARVHGGPEPKPVKLARDEPNVEDLVFCAIGSAGTGGPGQRRVAKSIEALAANGPLDFVLMLGDAFVPRGVESVADPGWQRCFETVYDPLQLGVPFYATVGDRDRRGSLDALLQYGRSTMRWTLSRTNYSFVAESHGEKFVFVCLDSKEFTANSRDPAMRFARRVVLAALRDVDAAWKIVFTHEPIYTNGSLHGTARTQQMRQRAEPAVLQYGADLILAGGDHHLELLTPKNGITHIVSGGGSGPDLARDVHWREDTVFAHTGGGSTWFRFDGKALRIVFRDADGEPVFVHRMTK